MTDSQFAQALKQALLQAELVLDRQLAADAGDLPKDALPSAEELEWSRDDAYWAAQFIGKIALAAREYELAGICRAVEEKGDLIREIEYEREDRWYERDWNNPDSYTEPLSASALGCLLVPQQNANAVNKLLASLGLLVRSNGGWMATEAAHPHAVQLNRHQKPFVRWRKSILPILGEMQQEQN